MSWTTKDTVKSGKMEKVRMEKKKKAANIRNVGQRSSFRTHSWLMYRQAPGAATLFTYLFFFMSKAKKSENFKEGEKKRRKLRLPTVS